MKAMVYNSSTGLTIKEVPNPVAGPGKVTIKIKNCGICGSDLFLNKSGFLHEGSIMGHELSGIIDTVGEGITGISPGDRVIARPAGCNKCKNCEAGMENICPERRSIGLGAFPGGFAEYMLADEDMIIPVPEKLTLDQACMADQLGSVLHGMRVAGFKPGESVLVTGAGPIGLCGVMLLKYFKAAKIIVAELNPNRAELARKFGADEVFDPTKKKMHSAIAEYFEPGRPDLVLECSGNAGAIQDIIMAAPVGCRIALVGMTMNPVTVIPYVLFQKHLSIFGSFGNTQKECIECMDIMASGEVPSADLITRKIDIEELPDAFKELSSSKDEIKVMMEL
ncbi:MAG TPA: alcohol dehydrogenase catalytic domain-containing protein [bacterium]|nr:alcohol dehydrogenase catalytic domain-containing protein [bacterium]